MAKASGVRLVLREDDLPASGALQSAAKAAGKTAAELVLHGGEDYGSLLFCTYHSMKDIDRFTAKYCHDPRIYLIGAVEEGEPGVTLLMKDGSRRDITPTGFQHF
jgi:thiamine monophosphate kinase